MDKVLAEMLARLAAIAEAHGELEDTEVQERLHAAVHCGFLIPTADDQLPTAFAMYSPEGDRAVREVLTWFVIAARAAAAAAAAAEGLDTFHKRLAAFQNLDVTVGPQRLCYNDFFGWTDPERFDESGNMIRRNRTPAGPGAAPDPAT